MILVVTYLKKKKMKVCKVCGIGIGDYLKHKTRKMNTCTICYSKQKSEEFKYWYSINKKPKDIKPINCRICNKLFTPKTRAKSCSLECSKKYISLRRKARRKLENLQKKM